MILKYFCDDRLQQPIQNGAGLVQGIELK